MKPYDVVLVGAGPCGLAAAADFKRAGKNYLHIEKGALAQTIQSFPKGITLYSPRELLEFGGIEFSGDPKEPPTREEYLQYLRKATRALALKVATYREVIKVTPGKPYHLIHIRDKSGRNEEYATRNLIVANGGYYTPVLLNIPGEDLPTVSHYFRSDLPVKGQRIVVVGGRNSAVEACNILTQKGAMVVLSYRGRQLPRKKIKPWLLPEFDICVECGLVLPRMRTTPVRVASGEIELRDESGQIEKVNCDRVLLLTGYGPDYSVLRMADVPFHSRTHRPLFSLRTLETKIPGIFLCGTIVLKWHGKQASIENTREHGRIILQHLR